MPDHAWVEEFPGAVTVCDADGIIIDMNARAAATFAQDGGKALIGCRLVDCHTGEAREKVERLLASRKANVYTIEKSGVRKLIYQSPWFRDGQYAGMVELSLVLPADIPHFVRTP